MFEKCYTPYLNTLQPKSLQWRNASSLAGSTSTTKHAIGAIPSAAIGITCASTAKNICVCIPNPNCSSVDNNSLIVASIIPLLLGSVVVNVVVQQFRQYPFGFGVHLLLIELLTEQIVLLVSISSHDCIQLAGWVQDIVLYEVFEPDVDDWVLLSVFSEFLSNNVVYLVVFGATFSEDKLLQLQTTFAGLNEVNKVHYLDLLVDDVSADWIIAEIVWLTKWLRVGL